MVQRAQQIAFSIFLFFLSSFSVQADGGEKVIMVLDGSGSMWGQIDGTAKIVIAREVIDGVLTNWDNQVELGLIAYGHREKGNCGDIETLVPVGPLDKAVFMERVNAINPKGKTPISTSVRQAADALKYTEEKATVILVSDGLETCDADPCALASELETKGIDFTTHVVGFDLTEEESAGLQCIADNTGGKFLQASNANELTAALTQTVEAVKDEPEEPQGIRLRARLCGDCEILADGKLFWWVYKPETDLEGKREELDRSGSDAPLFELTPGTYHVVGRYGNGSVYRNVDLVVEEGKTTDHVMIMDAGGVKLSAIPTAGAEPLDDKMFYWVYAPEKDLEGNQKEFDRSGSAAPLIWLMSGTYEVRARHGKAFASTELVIEAGKTIEHVFDMNAGYLRATGISTAGGEVLKDKMFYWVLSTTKDLEGKRTEIDRSGGAEPFFRLPAGTYLLRAQHGKAFAEKEVTVTAGALTEEQLDMNAGYLKVSAAMTEGGDTLSKKMFYWVLNPEKDLQGKQKEIDRAGSATPLFRLPAGDYVLRAQHGKALKDVDVTVTAGALNEQTIVMDSAMVRLTATTSDGNEIGKGLFWRLYKVTPESQGNHPELDRSGSAKPTFIVPAGDYIASVSFEGESTDLPLKLAAGEQKNETVTLKTAE